jgi:hypothetical protein
MMKKSSIHHFFKKLSHRIDQPIRIYLTGGIAAWFLGGVRPTQDIDFALLTKSDWAKISEQILRLSKEENIPVQFTEDISRWGMIGFKNFKKGAKRYQKFGHVEVYLLDPLIWSVGKIARYTQDDLEDMIAVFKKQKCTPQNVINTWVQALQESPRSSEHHLFIKKVEDFLKNAGPKIWGKKFNPEITFQLFRKKIS